METAHLMVSVVCKCGTYLWYKMLTGLVFYSGCHLGSTHDMTEVSK